MLWIGLFLGMFLISLLVLVMVMGLHGWMERQLKGLLIGNLPVSFVLLSVRASTNISSVTSNPFLDTTKLEQVISSSQPIGEYITTKLSNTLNLASLKGPIATKDIKSDYYSFPYASFHVIKGTKWFYSLIFSPISEMKTSVRIDLFYLQSQSSGDIAAVIDGIYKILEERVEKLEREFQVHLQNEE